MTIFSVYSDLHIGGSRPRHRIDSFANSLLIKLQEVYEISLSRDAEFVLFLGDLFTNHRIYSYDIIDAIIDIMSSSPLKTYGIVGQHDLRGYNRDTYKTSTLRHLERHCKQYETIWEPLTVGNVVIYPSHACDDFQETLTQKVIRKKKAILAAHHLITMSKQVFPTFVVGDILPCNYAAILFGDFHAGMKPYCDDKGTLVWGPGALTRLTIKEVERVVKMGIVSATPGKNVTVEEIPLSKALPGDQAFSQDSIDDEAELLENFDADGFIESLSEIEDVSIDIFELVNRAAKLGGLPDDVLEYILQKKFSES